MRTLTDHLAQYAAYHRDVRNIVTHFVGIPMIVLAVSALLSRPAVEIAGIPCSAALVLAVAFSAFYLSLDRALGLLMSGLMALSVVFGAWAAVQSQWLAIGVGGFVVGWLFQLVGHVFEGRKPAFVDDLIGLAVGPLFVVVELLFMTGALKSLHADIERRAGKVRGRLALLR